jgi:peroxiredoxin
MRRDLEKPSGCRVRWIFARAIAVALTAFSSLACSSEVAGEAPRNGLAASKTAHPLLGRKAPAFELARQLGTGSISLDQQVGKLVIVDFWATWCAPCRPALTAYQQLFDRYPSDLVVIGISIDEDSDGIESFVRHSGATFPVVWDAKHEVVQKYRPKEMPTSYFLDRRGIVRYVHEGFQSGDAGKIERRIQALLQAL